MSTVTLQELERDPLAVLRRAEAGESILVTRDDRPVVELRPALPVPPQFPGGKRPFGLAKGQFTVPTDFDAPLPEDIIKEFYGE